MFSTLNVSIKGHRYQYSSSSIVGDNKRMRACHVIEQCDTDDAFRLFAFDPSEFQYLLPTVSLWSIIPIPPPPPPTSISIPTTAAHATTVALFTPLHHLTTFLLSLAFPLSAALGSSCLSLTQHYHHYTAPTVPVAEPVTPPQLSSPPLGCVRVWFKPNTPLQCWRRRRPRHCQSSPPARCLPCLSPLTFHMLPSSPITSPST